jgi:hypothetical protein
MKIAPLLDRLRYGRLRFADVDRRTLEIIAGTMPYTMTSRERVLAAISAARYIAAARLPGAVIECGVWKGGSVMAILRALLDAGDATREVYLFDTFEGMTRPTDADRDVSGVGADERLQRGRSTDTIWARAAPEEVTQNVLSTGYPNGRVHLVKGRVEDTIPEHAPEQIALLRLDTDWYESTLHELRHLYPRLVRGGVLIIDDYGHWQGARKAVDEYFAGSESLPFLQRIDYSGRIATKR